MRSAVLSRPRTFAALGGLVAMVLTATLVVAGAVSPSNAEPAPEPIAALHTLAVTPPSDSALVLIQADRMSRFAEAFDAQQLQDYAEAVDAAAVFAQAASDAQAAAIASQPGAPADGYWDRMANCETGGNWRMTGSRYSGGVGFANSTWSAYGGREFAGNAGQATREQQIIVANRVATQGYGGTSAVGYSAWGCTAHVGRP